ncbi:MAG TPA: hypothetical protein VGP25_06540 [Gemmatimonadaceae bacterium]|nr:hypothetical protein [Gemmatimonadaceae bacterium]
MSVLSSTSEITPSRPVKWRRARMITYALWQLRDYLMDRGVPTFIVATLFGYLGLQPLLASMDRRTGSVPAGLIAKFGSEAAARAVMMDEFNYMFLRGFIGTLVFLGALFAMNGIVANDRKLGFYRFLFAKPVTPARYYGQAFLVHWIGFLGVMTLLGLIYGALVWPVLSWPLMIVVALTFLCFAGVAFLLSAAARWDWLSLVAVSVAATYLWGRYASSTSPFAKLLYLLPPLHRTDEVYASVSGRPTFAAGAQHVLPWGSIWWLAGYGAACFVLGLVVLRYRRLAIV